MDVWILPVVLNVVLGIIAWLGKTQLDNMRRQQEETERKLEQAQKDINSVKNEYLSKQDFRDFKQELYNRMDMNHADLIRQIAKGQ
jgi:uncharacterized membrane-anchored protein YhcB (DUF1043 family)